MSEKLDLSSFDLYRIVFKVIFYNEGEFREELEFKQLKIESSLF